MGDVDLPKASTLHAQAQQDRVAFLQTDLALCFTFCDLANIELHMMGDRTAALHVQGKAEQGFRAIEHLLAHIDDSVQKEAILGSLNELRLKLDKLHERF